MALPKTKQRTEIDDDTLQQAVDLLDDESFSSESLNPALETLYAEMGIHEGGEAKVYVTLLDSDKGEEANIWRGEPDEYDLERLAKQFGSGKYRVKIYVRNATGQRVLKANKVFTWKLTPEDDERRKNPQIAQPAFNPMELSRLIAESIKAALPSVAPVVNVPQVDPMDQLERFSRIMANLRPQETQQTAPVNQLSSLRDMAELLDVLRGPRDDDGPRGANGNDLILAALNKFAPLLGTVLSQGTAPGQVVQQSQSPQIAQQPQQPQQPQNATMTAEQTDEAQQMSMQLKLGLNWLIGQCNGGGAPETYAEVVLDSVPEEAVKQLIDSPAPLDYLAQFDPRVKTEPYLTWFTNLIASIREFTKEDVSRETGGTEP